MKKAAFYQIQDGDTGAQVAQGLQGNFETLQQEIEAIPSYSLPIQMDPNSGIINSEEDYNSILPESYLGISVAGWLCRRFALVMDELQGKGIGRYTDLYQAQ